MERPPGARQAFFSFSEPFNAASFIAALALVCPIVSCVSRAHNTEQPPKDPVILRIGVIEFTKQDPLYGLQQASQRLSLEALVSNGMDGRPLPWLAKNWSVSPDGLRWTFTLRPDAKFQDGSPVDAETVKRALDEFLASLSDRSLFPGVEDVVTVQASGSNDLVITLRDRSTFLLGDLSMAISKQREGEAPLGTGPFVATSSSAEQILMSRFDDYYQGAPQIQQVVWKPYPALRTAWAGMMRGEIDFLYEVGQETIEFVQGESSVLTFPFLRPYVFGVLFNSSRPFAKDPRVRQALNFAVNRQLIVDQALRGHGQAAHTPIWPLHWAYDHEVGGFTYDPARASAILDAVETNPKKSPNEKMSRPGRLRFTCLLPENFPVWERMALLVQKQLFDVGVDMRLEELPADAFNERVGHGDFDAVFLELNSLAMSRAYVSWHSASRRNFFGYRNLNVDEALDGIRRAPDDQTYRSSVAQLQRAMIANPPAIFLAWGQTARAVSRRFHVPSAPNTDIFGTVSSWQLTEHNESVTN